MLKLLSACALLLCGCTSLGRPDAQPACSPLPGWSEVANASVGKYLIFGEFHGTRESPRAVQEFVCQIAADPVLLAVEIPSTHNGGLQKAWATTGDFPSALFTELPGFFGAQLDGNGSQAVFDMLVRLHALKNAGAKIDVVAFAGARDAEQKQRFASLPGQGPSEATYAENIRIAAEARAYRHVVIQVGSLHAQKKAAKIGSVAFDRMAMQLAQPEQVVSLKMGSSSGSAWNCVMKPDVDLSARRATLQDLECSEHPLDAYGVQRDGPSMRLSPQLGYDGDYFLGAASASPPSTRRAS